MGDKWSEDGQIQFIDGIAYGITPELQTIPLGNEEDVLHFLKTGELKDDLHPKQYQVLTEIREEREKNGIKESSIIRSRPVRTFKRRKANTRQAKKRKGATICHPKL